MLTVQCPHCMQQQEIPDPKPGQGVQCYGCFRVFVPIPRSAEAVQGPQAAESGPALTEPPPLDIPSNYRPLNVLIPAGAALIQTVILQVTSSLPFVLLIFVAAHFVLLTVAGSTLWLARSRLMDKALTITNCVAVAGTIVWFAVMKGSLLAMAPLPLLGCMGASVTFAVTCLALRHSEKA